MSIKSFFIICLLFVGTTSWAQTVLIEAAFAWDKSTLYFTQEDRVVKYNLDFNKVEATMMIGEAFPGVTFNYLDAIMDAGDGFVYFFSGNEFIKFNKKSNFVEEGYPQTINGKTWAGLAFQPIDAALNWPNEKCFFFGEKEYVRYHQKEKTVEENYPKTINTSTWPGLPFDRVDAALQLSKDKVFLFKGEEFVSFDIPSDKMDLGYPKNIRMFSGLQEALMGNGAAADKYHYDKFLTIDQQQRPFKYSVKQEGIDLLFDKEQAAVSYVDFKNKKHQLYPWYGKHVVYLTTKKDLNKEAMYLLLAYTDRFWEEMEELTVRNSPKAHQNFLLNGRSTIAVLPKSSFGKAQGNSGFNGVELNAVAFSYDNVLKHLTEGTALEIDYEGYFALAGNFAIFENKLTIDDKKNAFNSHELFTGTFKKLCTSVALASAPTPVTKEGTYESYKKKTMESLHQYLTAKDKTIENTILQQVDHQGGPSYNLMGTLLSFVGQNYGGQQAIQRMWKALPYLQQPTSKQDLMDNYFVMACFGAKTDLTKLFEHQFKYTISDRVQQEVQEFAKRNFE